MQLKISKFGHILISRPAGREAYLAAHAYSLPKKIDRIELDFKGVKVLSPSWISEFVSLLRKDYPAIEIKFLNTQNPSVSQSLDMIE